MTDQPQHRLRELFEFDAKTGHLIWRTRPVEEFATVRGWKNFNTQFSGTVAGSINDGYRRIGIDGKMWTAHRLIWIYANGDIPDGIQVDHINGNRDDNRLENLRLVTHSENQRNSSVPRNNTSGALGVSWYKRAQKWQAHIKIDGRSKSLGLFDTVEAAAAARAMASIENGYHPGHGKSPALAPASQKEAEPVDAARSTQVKPLEAQTDRLMDILFGQYDPSSNYHCWVPPSRKETREKLLAALESMRSQVGVLHPTPTPVSAPVGVEKWPEPGDKMQFLDRNGYDVELEAARKVFTKGQVVTVKKFDLGGWCSSITFEELPGKWNSVMFARSPAAEGK